MVDYLQTIVEYNYALHQQVWQSIDQISDEQFFAPLDYSHGSLHAHLVHLASVDTRWLSGLQGQEPPAHADSADYPTRDAVRAYCQQAAAAVIAYVQTLDEASANAMPGEIPAPRWQIIAHMVNHGTDHRAQMLRVLHDYGAPTFDQDLILYHFQQLRQRNA